ncbi:hypothetical protein [Chitinophaga tropicalis]|uniref:Uncharacterized protein n=1 Tax=Chitinophaga tropicalis TaxID=2683588 RepID=A0A7K1U2U9_9BACT|nr:hypothetical protein [Chitinophaga tropicalis]MVT08692.1 hypothetical protein [Chitinophaga tropicalis]
MSFLNICLLAMSLSVNDSTCLDWEKSTVSDIKYQLQHTGNQEKEYFQGLLSGPGDTTTLREQRRAARCELFYAMKLFYPDLFGKYFIVETTTDGEIKANMALILDVTNADQAVLYVYEQTGNAWMPASITRDLKVDVSKGLEGLRTTFQQGHNKDAVIVSEFEWGVAKSSVFMVNRTLAENTWVTNILGEYIPSYKN